MLRVLLSLKRLWPELQVVTADVVLWLQDEVYLYLVMEYLPGGDIMVRLVILMK